MAVELPRREWWLRATAALWLAAATLAAVLPVAWIADDAIFTLHQVRVFVAGDGIVWNPGVRVQTFTHPAWFLLLVPLHWATGALFLPVIVLSVALTLAALLLLWRAALAAPGFAAGARLGGRWAPLWAAGAVALLALASPSFREFATSGLETPLSHLLVIAAALRLLSGAAPGAGDWALLALAVLTRPDHAVLLGPVAALQLLRAARAGRLAAVLPGAAMLAAWAGFAALYFGSVVPNTAHAKAFAGIPAGEAAAAGLAYLRDAALHDGTTLPVLLGGLIAGAVAAARGRRPAGERWALAALALGMALHLLYLVSIGGDFMRGRLLSVPMLLGALLLLTTLPRRPPVAALAAVPPLLVALASLSAEREAGLPVVSEDGIVREGQFYLAPYGLFSARRAWPEPPPARFSAETPAERVIFICGFAGTNRFIHPPKHVIVDYCGLGDPFLARLPAARREGGRPGHHLRALPRNLDLVLLGREARLSGGHGQALFEAVRRAVTGPLWDRDRLVAALRLALGLERADAAARHAFRAGAPGLVMPSEPSPARWTIRFWPGDPAPGTAPGAAPGTAPGDAAGSAAGSSEGGQK